MPWSKIIIAILTGLLVFLLAANKEDANLFLVVLIAAIITLFVEDLFLLIGVSISVSVGVLALAFFIDAGHKFYMVMTEVSK